MTSIEPVRKNIVIDAPQAHVFNVFTVGIDTNARDVRLAGGVGAHTRRVCEGGVV